MMVTICGECETNNILVLVTRFMPPSLSTQVALCEWALKGNFYKHQVIILLACTDLPSKNIIEYYDTYFGIHCGGLKPMFVDLAYLQLDDGAFMMKITTKIRLMRSTLLTLGGL